MPTNFQTTADYSGLSKLGRQSKLTLKLAVMWSLRWVCCLFAAVLILSYLSSSNSTDSQSVEEFANTASEGNRFVYDPPGSNIEIIVDMIVVGVAGAVIVALNAAVSWAFLKRIAEAGNQLWALLALVSWPLFLVGCFTLFNPGSNSFAIATALVAMPLDALLVAFIGRRIWLDRSPFFNLGLIDYA